MAQQYIIVVSLIALMALVALARWTTPTQDLLIFTEAKKVEKVMFSYARQRCLDDTDTSDGSTLTSQILPVNAQLDIVDFINSGAVKLTDIGFSKTLTLPLIKTANNISSPNTNIVWRFIGWRNGAAIIDASSVFPKTLTVLKLLYPLHSTQTETRIRIILSPERSRQYRDEFSYLSEELFYQDTAPQTPSGAAYPIEKRLCLM
ncbi:MAG: hypothetical protein P8I38_10945 [Arenicella sp.]|jgi:hypothetical protein|nr:hypothetical protein [Arenicella sp.]HAU68362.1 hypothetical protein [Gammaproteobacteria bacterium]